MTQLELFAGIGGFGLAGHWAGIETVCQVEIDPFCQKVLAKNFPNAHRHDDIKTFDGTQWRGVDIISGGFPCQPYSTAGKRLGTEDERHLWPEMLRVIREAQLRYVVGENVGGLISWSDGVVFEQVCADLEAEGYEVQPFILPACAVNAPHRRDRVWFVAHCIKRELQARQPSGKKARITTFRNVFQNDDATNPDSAGRQKHNFATFANRSAYSSRIHCKESWNEWTSEPPICRMDDGISGGLDKNRNNRIKALGNAIVPQVAFQIFKAIIETEKMMSQ